MSSLKESSTVGALEWRIRVCMATAGIRFATELHQRLVDVLGSDVAPSESQISRLVRQRPERLNLAVLAGLCDVLDCEPGDLLQRPDRRR